MHLESFCLGLSLSASTCILTDGVEPETNTKSMNIKDRLNLDTLLEAAILATAAILAFKLFGAIIDVVLFVALAVIAYVGIRNRDLLLAKLKELQQKAQDLI